MTEQNLLPLVLSAGFLDSFNPCAIAILLIFTAMMFTLRKSRKAILLMGLTYITSIYISYLAIGLGLLKVVYLFNTPHIISLVGTYLLLAAGFWGLKENFFPGKFNFLTIPLKSRQIIASWAFKATIPAAAITGLLVGIFEFPCSGAIYVATISLLAKSETYLQGIFYLLLYNLMFVLPLIIIFLALTNRFVVEKLINLDEKYASFMRLASSIIMIAIALVILIWFI